MSERDVNILVSAQDAASRTFQDVGRSAEQLRGRLRAGGDESLRLLGPLSKVGALFAGAGVITGGVRLLTAGIQAARGEGEAMLESLERLPFGLGKAVRAGHELYDALSGAREEAERMALVQAGHAGARQLQGMAISGQQSLTDIRDKLLREADMAGMSGSKRAAAQVIAQATQQIAEIDALQQRLVSEAAKVRSQTLLGEIAKSPVLDKQFDEKSLNAERMRLEEERAKVQARLQGLLSAPGAERTGFARSNAAAALRGQIETLTQQLRPIERVFAAADAAKNAVETAVKTAAAGAKSAAEQKRDAELAALRQGGDEVLSLQSQLRQKQMRAAGEDLDAEVEQIRESYRQKIAAASEGERELLEQLQAADIQAANRRDAERALQDIARGRQQALDILNRRAPIQEGGRFFSGSGDQNVNRALSIENIAETIRKKADEQIVLLRRIASSPLLNATVGT